MIMCERDQSFPWANELFRDPFASTGYYGPPNGYNDGYYCDHHYTRDASHPDETHLHSSALTYDFYNPSVGVYHHGNVGGQEHEAVYVDPSSSSSYPASDDCFEMEEEVGKRFYPMVPVAHVPKINGQIPSFDEATMDHERLSDRLKLYELVEHKVKGDGNCQFRALSDQLYQTPDHHEFVREQIISQLKSNRDAYDGYVPMAYDEYLDKVSRNGEWGDHVTLQAAADKYGVKIFVMTSFKDTCYIEIQPKVVKSNKVVLLSFWAEVHYNSISPQNEAPRSHIVKKRRWWPFSQHHH
ncbi:OVARIAN TUMOR DOMAIN-containing deubiquitinating enzyme 9-like [Lolium rigidum]|uniref:OVARIAN TUMOR DOMAIN-containing deubiquitinating enzyme 9-like n=1 Tax=Lolium rigidum TaxID=89674 RepID=UPI001F5D8C4C|nr:OVARIAN TUMOR DOMAIN-containing deubiquitinating enzyme 9-like [Lolium rigidum]XP_047083017.1 OVARIAN TUMOR DOMAIN-containing deubiquitinating enzyme 9-like [Lolium rigidum]